MESSSESVWTNLPPAPDVPYWFKFDGGESVDQLYDDLVKQWDASTAERSIHPIPSAEELAAMRKLVEVARHVANQLSFYKPTDKERAEYAECLRAAIKECEQP